VTDSQGVPVFCTRAVLAPGGQQICNAFGIAQSGQYSNTGTATATYMGDTITDSDPSHYFGESLAETEPAIVIKKFTNGVDADEPPGPLLQPGDPITWNYVVVNTGNAQLIDVTVTDDQGVSVTCPQDTLEIGEFMICTATGIAAAGQYANIATVEGTPIDQPNVTDEDPSHYFGIEPAITIKKYTNGPGQSPEDADTPPGPFISAGDAVDWSYVVTNTGTVELHDIVVSDSQGVNVNCPQLVLQPGESMTCTGDEGTAQPGQYANVGTVTGAPPQGPDVTAEDPSHYFGSAPAIEIKKYTNDEDADMATGPFVPVGDAVNWTYVVTNTGNLTLTNVTVSDDQGVSVTCPQDTLEPGATMTCTAAGSAAAGQYANLGAVVGTPPGGLSPVSAEDPSHYFGSQPGIALKKYTNSEDADTATGPLVLTGDDIRWTYVISNTGNVPLFSFQVTDSMGVPVACPRIGLIDPGLSVTCFGSGTAQIGQYANVGTATATPPTGGPLTAEDPSHYFGVEAGIALKKYTNGEDADLPPGPNVDSGANVVWSYVVTNTSNVMLSNVVLEDDQIGLVSCPQNVLQPGEVMTCTVTGTAVSGQYANLATVSAIPPVGAEVVDEDPSHYLGVDPTDLPEVEQPARPYEFFLPQINQGTGDD
jgi:hypothetical protein